MRPQLTKRGLFTAAQLKTLPDGRLVKGCGIVTMRQQSSTAKGVSFVTLEDETRVINVIVCRAVRDEQRAAFLQSRLMAVEGVWQRQGRCSTWWRAGLLT